MQGRTDPVPIILKYDVMGMGRMEMEMDYAEDATEKRRVLEVEKEETEELRQKYKDQIEKEKAIAKALEDLRANFYCELCDKQYTKHQEFDNHINSYDHAHKQRLKDLKQREFARNVSSRSRKGGKKQEKMLRRLHELAEQRKQQDCTPGSGPMFKTTTVAVAGEKAEDGDRFAHESAPVKEKALVAKNRKTEKTSQKSTSSFSFSLGKKKNCSSPTTSASSKVSVSFSFAKKTPVKLETAAAVFTDPSEEVIEGEDCEESEKSAAEQDDPSACNVDSPKGGLRGSDGGESSGGTGTDETQPPNDESSLASTLNKLKMMMMMKKEEGNTGQEPQYYHYMPPAHCRVKPHFQFLLFMKASEQGQSKEEEEEDEGQEEKVEDASQDTDSNTVECENQENNTTTNTTPEAEKSPPASKPQDGDDVPHTAKTTPDLPASPALKEESSPPPETLEPDSGPKIPVGPFFPVLSKDESTTLQWPSELLEFTKAQPSLSYSCNPLYFDFKLSRNKGPRAAKTAKSPKPSERPDKDKQNETTPSKVEPLLKTQPDGDQPTVKAERGQSEADDGEAATSGGGSKKKKKKKKHKKSAKRSKRKAKDKDAAAEDAEGETEPTQETPKKKKKHKRKKSKNKAANQEEAAGEAKEKAKVKSADKPDPSSEQAQERGVPQSGKRKRVLKDPPNKEEGGTGKSHEKAPPSEEHGNNKRIKTEPGLTQSASCSSWAQKSPGSGRPPSSESEEEGASATQRSRRRKSSPREERRHRSEESGRSRSHSSRRGGGRRRSRRGKTSQSRSYSSSSERSSAGSSAYSRRSRSYSDSYSDYSTEGRRRGRSKRSSDSDYERRGGRGRRRSGRRRYSTSSSDDSRSRSRSYGRRKRHRRRRRSTSGSSSGWSRSTSARSARSWRRSYSRSRSSGSRSSSSAPAGSPRRRSARGSGEALRGDFNRSGVYRSQSPRVASRGLNRVVAGSQTPRLGATRDAGEYKNSLTARQLLEKIQSKKNSDDSVTGTKSGLKIKDPPQGYFGPKLPPSSKSMLPLFGKLQTGKKAPTIPLSKTDEGEKSGAGKSAEADGEVILVEPIREFPPPPPPPPVQKVEVSETTQEETSADTQVLQEPRLLYEQDSSVMIAQYQGEQEPPMETLMPDMQQQQTPMHGYAAYAPTGLEEDGLEAEEDGLAPLESQPITFTPEEMEKYSKLQQAAQQHIQQQLLAKQVKSFPSAAAAAVAAAAANLAPAPPPPALQQIHIQQPAASAASGTSIATVQHAILQHHAAAAMGIHPAHPAHPAHAQLAQVHHIPQHHLTPISLSPLGPALGHSLGHSLGHAGLIPAHPTAFLSGQPIHIIPASALHHTPLALHHVPHAALYPTLFTPRPSQAAAAAAALQLHPLLHPIFSGQDLQHPPNHGS
ncbi:G patch domain-containing protein 8 isoform X2 [Corythoichthys intestinalis]|nr:G patch domain-containing protein 8 isoform X2 [Corythoichthys intestinalis]XP_057716812.1 G patch domain-containing protein 8 isoform X2 [Corythoichthys intestinalis]XP_057716813.1 G patch domain-containing protein 8 isoform X2 [Corythoichthys intestinalis]XP_057716814.1 G patch domain-containing protein 8 isoform X2 [Corythoichthys intestinalis]XP_057716815.1 G patch domain-containing protein 8 isoform X2 [Corythoichthys intestinalis]XP_057716816.1 G patch domain-containing protein 8 isof